VSSQPSRHSAAIAAVLATPEADFELQEVELDELRADEVLVRIEACGVCYTDTECRHLVPTPSVLGHEGAGVVERVGERVSKVQPGDRVVLTYPSCGTCANCRSGHAHCCDHVGALAFGGQRLDGSRTIRRGGQALASAFFQQSSFATRAVAHERGVVGVPANTEPALLAAMACGVMTGAGAVVNTLALQKGESLAVFGTGAVGMSALMAAHIVGCVPIVAIDVNPQRLALALELGATHAVQAGEGSAARLGGIVPRGFDAALDTSGRSAAMAVMFNALAMGGRAGIVTPPADGGQDRVLLDQLFSRAGILHSVYQGSSQAERMIPQLLQWHAAGEFPVERLISRYPFPEINRAFADAKAGVAIKPVLLMGGQGT